MNNIFIKDIIREVKGSVYLLNSNKEVLYRYSNISSADSDSDNVYKALTSGIFDCELANVVIDSRKVESDNVYVALKGERSDGNDYIISAFDKGALLSIGERNAEKLFSIAHTEDTFSESVENDDAEIDIEWIYDNSDECAYIYIEVEDSVYALGRIAHRYMQILDIPVVAITGSVGKTSAKETIASVLATRFNIGKTPGNYNNEIGLPLTCFTFDSNTEIAILEMGISEPDEMDYLTDIVRPNIAVVTNIGVTHIENLGSREAIYSEKIKLVDALKPEGIAILNADDDYLNKYSREDIVTRFFSMTKPDSEYTDTDMAYADSYVSCGLLGSTCKLRNIRIHNKLTDIDIKINVPGKHMVYAALASALVGGELGLNADEIAKGIAQRETTNGRMNIIQSDSGYIVIDDCYNASPDSMKAGIDTLTYAEGRKICILGDMFELGSDELVFHREVGEYLAEKDIDILITVGKLSKEIAKGAKSKADNMEIHSFEDNLSAIDYIKELLQSGDTLLVKASNSMRFNEIVDAVR